MQRHTGRGLGKGRWQLPWPSLLKSGCVTIPACSLNLSNNSLNFTWFSSYPFRILVVPSSSCLILTGSSFSDKTAVFLEKGKLFYTPESYFCIPLLSELYLESFTLTFPSTTIHLWKLNAILFSSVKPSLHFLSKMDYLNNNNNTLNTDMHNSLY